MINNNKGDYKCQEWKKKAVVVKKQTNSEMNNLHLINGYR